jgi:hypothetical protein
VSAPLSCHDCLCQTRNYYRQAHSSEILQALGSLWPRNYYQRTHYHCKSEVNYYRQTQNSENCRSWVRYETHRSETLQVMGSFRLTQCSDHDNPSEAIVGDRRRHGMCQPGGFGNVYAHRASLRRYHRAGNQRRVRCWMGACPICLQRCKVPRKVSLEACD